MADWDVQGEGSTVRLAGQCAIEIFSMHMSIIDSLYLYTWAPAQQHRTPAHMGQPRTSARPAALRYVATHNAHTSRAHTRHMAAQLASPRTRVPTTSLVMCHPLNSFSVAVIQ